MIPDTKAVDRRSGIVFLAATRAQIQDALHIIRELDPAINVGLVTLFRGRGEVEKFTASSPPHGLRSVSVPMTDLSLPLPKSIGQFYQIVAVRYYLKKFKKKNKACALVTGDDLCPVERSAIAFAKKKSITTILVQDGILIDPTLMVDRIAAVRKSGFIRHLIRKILRYREFLPDAVAYGASNCDVFAVWGEEMRSRMIRYGTPPEKLVAVGSPRMDSLIRAEQALPRLSPNSSLRIVLFASLILSRWKFGTVADDRRMMSSLDTLAGEDPNLEFIVRPHPSEKLESYLEMFKFMNIRRLKIDRDTPLPEELNRCSLVLTYMSTVAVEGMIMGKPVICLPMSIDQTEFFGENGPAVLIKELIDLRYWVNALLDDEEIKRTNALKRKEFIEKQFSALDGKSSFRTARLIERSLSAGRT